MNGLSQLDNVDYGDPAIKESINNCRLHPLPLPPPNDKPLDDMDEISDHWSEPPPKLHIHVLVGPPNQMSPVIFATGHANDLAPAVTLNTISQAVFERSDTVEKNNIHKLDGTEPEPDFLAEFKTKLGQHRWIKSGTEVCFFRSHLPSSY